jgi:2-oxoglutarate dehydrogenase E2 component (dihydrolipoamide succinyltransferase)
MGQTVDITMASDEREGTQSFVLRWLKNPGETVVIHEPLLEISTDKVTLEVAAPASGVLMAVCKGENDQVSAGEVLGKINAITTTTESSSTSREAHSGSSEINSASTQTMQLSPAVRKLLAEHRIDPALVSGTGSGGRITHEDVLAYLAKAKDTASKATQPLQSLQSHSVPHSPMRRSIAHHMVHSILHTAPHVTTVFEADLTTVLEHRERERATYEAQGIRLTLTAYFVRAMVAAVRAVPEVNSRWHDDSLEIFDTINVGIATALPAGGLVVPVIRGAENLSLRHTAEQLTVLTERARTGALSAADLQDGTCTITNHGVSGSLIATPIINQPQSAILGVGKLQKRVVVVSENGEDVARIRPMVFVTLTIDHRVLDGFQANSFLTAFVEALR